MAILAGEPPEWRRSRPRTGRRFRGRERLSTSHRAPSCTEAENGQLEAKKDDQAIHKGRSIMHNVIDQKKAVYVSLDIETGGVYRGVARQSSVRSRAGEGKGERQATSGAARKPNTTFNE